MTIRKLSGTATSDLGVFWSDCIIHDGWRIQYNKTLASTKFLKPYRLLDPQSILWASADSLNELKNSLPQLVDNFTQMRPLVSDVDVKNCINFFTSRYLPDRAHRNRAIL